MSATTSYLHRSTPGVYINEIAAFGTAIVGVATAVPVFIGYTQFAGDPTTGASLYNKPVPVSSMTEFQQYFGGAASAPFSIEVLSNPTPPSSNGSEGPAANGSSGSGAVASNPTPSFFAGFTSISGGTTTVVSKPFSLQADASAAPNQFNLYWAMQLFFANGGGNCFVVSVGSYWNQELPTSLPNPLPPVPGTIELGSVSPEENGLIVGLAAAGYAVGPTMIVIPEACQLNPSDYSTLVCAMLSQASTLQDRVALLDLPDCQSATTLTELQACQTSLATAIAPQISSASYGVSYAPALNTSIVSPSGILYTNIVPGAGQTDVSVINNILTTQANAMYSGAALATVQCAIAAAFPLPSKVASANNAQYSASTTATAGSGGTSYPPYVASSTSTLAQWQQTLDNYLLNAVPVFKQIEQLIANSMNVMPPSGALAGVYAKSDNLNGVWNAPANIALASVISPLYVMTDADQAGFNVPLNGQAINIIRAQPNRGNVVWGARTLDGNSLDYRYVQVRRTLIYVEQSIKGALQPYVFAANDATTWSTVIAAISSFLTGLWQQGGLMGSKPSDAFTVSCGLGSTMTAQNVLDGYMVVAVTLQMIHPAEFIELTFTQTMGT